MDRNDLCQCGSGKKYKKCCMGKENIFKSLGQNYLGEDICFDEKYSNNILLQVHKFNEWIVNIFLDNFFKVI